MRNILAQKQNLCCIFMQKLVAIIHDSIPSFAKKEIFRRTIFANFGSLSVDRKHGFGRNRNFGRPLKPTISDNGTWFGQILKLHSAFGRALLKGRFQNYLLGCYFLLMKSTWGGPSFHLLNELGFQMIFSFLVQFSQINFFSNNLLTFLAKSQKYENQNGLIVQPHHAQNVTLRLMITCLSGFWSIYRHCLFCTSGPE